MELAGTVQRVVQVTIAEQVNAALAAAVPSAPRRIALAVGAAVLLAGGRARLRSPLPSVSVLADLALAVATAALLQALAAGGPDSLPLRLANLCAVLEAGQALAPVLGDLAGGFLYNVQFLFAGAFAGALLAPPPSLAALAAVLAAAAVAALVLGPDALLTGGLVNASLLAARALLLSAVPRGLQLPSLVALVSFASPLHTELRLNDPVYDFALYQAADAAKAVAEAHLAPLPAAAACLAALAVCPTPALAAAAQIAAVGAVVDLIFAALQPALGTDPFLCLLPVLVFARVIASLGAGAP